MTGDTLTRWTIRAALLLYAAALALRLARPTAHRAARFFWTAGCLLFLAHVAAAFHFFHGWSHSHAYRETARQTKELVGADSGGGLYLNYLFTLAWAADVGWWWRAGLERYARRPRWVDVSLHAFMLFMAFNATAVFERGAIRWTAVGLMVLLAVGLMRRLRRTPTPAGPGGAR